VFSQESLKVKLAPVRGTQLLMFGGDVESSYVFRGAPSQRSAYKHRRTRVAGDGKPASPVRHGVDPNGQSRANKVMLTGRLGRNARLRETKSGQMVADFFVGTDEFHKDLLGQWQRKTAWHRVQVWGEAAKMVSTPLREDAEVYVEGKLVIRKWIDKKNKRQRFTEILASEVRCLDEGRKTVAGGDGRVVTEGKRASD
jgi:single-strand DNA-binding protein